MGRSITISCIGEGPIIDSRKRIYYAMNRMEIHQEIEKAHRHGEHIKRWYAQTKQGWKTLGVNGDVGFVKSEEVPQIKMIQCPICEGIGSKENGQFKRVCVICNDSGITRPGYWNNWSDWQLEEMRKEFAA